MDQKRPDLICALLGVRHSSTIPLALGATYGYGCAMAVWLVRAGGNGENENYVLENNVVAIGWESLGDLSSIKSREELLSLLEQRYPDAKHKARLNWRSQIWPLRHEIQIGDVVALPLKHRPAVAFGEVTGGYQYVSTAPNDAKHQRPVKWIREVPRNQIAQDLRFSLGAFMTVCRLTRNDAEQGLHALMKAEVDPLPATDLSTAEDSADLRVDYEEVARDEIRRAIYARYKGGDLARLVGAVFEAQGYSTVVSPPGADGGVDVIAGVGLLGFGSPRIVVQVKSNQDPVDVKVVRELQGVMKQFSADHGLVVAWGGFKSSVIREMARQFFEIRLWTGDELIDQILHHYDALPADLRAELPLKRIWVPARLED